MTRRVLLVSHAVRADMQRMTIAVAGMLAEAGIEAVVPAGDDWPHEVFVQAGLAVAPQPEDPAAGCELVCVLGGDGTILRGAGLARRSRVPLLGINFGHVGFLAEAEREDLAATVQHIVAKDYHVQDRMTLDVEASLCGEVFASSWALNEVTVEKSARVRMVELAVEIEGRPLSTYGCDGVIMATPTGSTAYAFSAGGPIVWPDVEAMLIVPISAHALFAKPLVVGPSSRVAVELTADAPGRGVMWCDGSRPVELPPKARVEVSSGEFPIRIARVASSPFTDRLVAKFRLPVHGWRGARRPGLLS